MQAVLSTIGRFHTFDLARQLEKRKLLRTVFSGYPLSRLKNEGLPNSRIKTFPWLHAPYMALKSLPAMLKREWEWQDRVWFDRYVAARVPDCDVFHALSGSSLRSGRAAQKRGARYICDRGSSHISFQNEILTEEYSRHGLKFRGVDPRVIDSEQAEYEDADAITVPSQFARDTFVAKGVPEEKLFIAPYGVELSRFRPISSPVDDEFQVLFAGSVCIRKGIPYLLQAFDKLVHGKKRLVIAGGVEAPLESFLRPFRQRPDIIFHGHLPQAELMKVMSESHVMVLPSVEEGFGLVQAQALACGCPVIASTNTGASNLFQHAREGFTIPIRSADAITEKLQKLADDPHLQHTMSQSALAGVRALGGWDRYGDAITEIFHGVLESRNVAA